MAEQWFILSTNRRIQVRLGTNLDPKNIREGSDVYFDCIINAHPYGKTLLHNVGHGVIISNQSLVLQGVGRKTAGNYTCVGFNAEGDGESKPFTLDVLYAPTCRSSQQRVHGVAKQERAHITCHVDANPPEVTFRWTFNNTANSNEVSNTYVSRAGTSSTVTSSPQLHSGERVTDVVRGSMLGRVQRGHATVISLRNLPRTAFQMSGAMSAAVGGGGVIMVILVLFMIAVRQRCAKRKPRSAPLPSSQPASPDKLREKDDSEIVIWNLLIILKYLSSLVEVSNDIPYTKAFPKKLLLLPNFVGDTFYHATPQRDSVKVYNDSGYDRTDR
ncbi:Opioid-binding protein/cell adhesion molecule [Operophtera brumata]|uniref:Opioid-binding protein/cell adhesion molecule n=1 Tax=Operophtera brumata TaxID=104452 RepID=A0A0L7KT83_OPEBR|nr:Opioid-binding protein/cell adhesion molecule [Operophtera brumata]